MLGSFLAHGLTRAEAESEALVQILAGSDTTATAIRTTMLYLMTSPRAYARLAAEVRAAAAAGTISSPVTDAQARELPYLQAVIKEGLRIHPPVAGTMDVLVPRGGEDICGFHVPAGTEIGASVFSVQTRTDIYGDDADVFRPERWLEADDDEDRRRRMLTTWGLIFKTGKWQCLGKDVALLELNKVFVEVSYYCRRPLPRLSSPFFYVVPLSCHTPKSKEQFGSYAHNSVSQLFRRYDFTLVHPDQPWVSMQAGIFIQSHLYTKVTRIKADAMES